MVGIVVVFPNKDNATNIRNLLSRGGIDVIGVCTTGAQAMNYADTVDEGIVICGYKLADMMYSDLREYLPPRFQMLLIASPGKFGEGEMEGVIGLDMPIKAYDLIETVQMMLHSLHRERKRRRLRPTQRNPKQDALILQAKNLLMDRNNMTEEEAHKYLQKTSMDSGRSMVETAEMVLSIMA